MKNATNTKKTTRRPNVKWGSLIGSLVFIAIAILLFILNALKVQTGLFEVDLLIAYGPIPAAFLLLPGVAMLTEDFFPSVSRVRAYKARKRK